MYNSLDTSCGEIHNVGCDAAFPKFIDYHNHSLQIPNLPYYSNVKTSRLSRDGQNEVSKEYTGNYEGLDLVQMPKDLVEDKLYMRSLLSLNVCNNKLEYFPLEILEIRTLQILKMDSNKIKSLPIDIDKLINLDTFTIAFNGLQFLPAAIVHLAKLKELNLEGNALDQLPRELDGLKNLRILNLIQNKLDSLPTSFAKLISLNNFGLEWFRYTDPRMEIHQKGDGGARNIQKLREKCSALLREEVKNLDLTAFLNLFSMQKIDLRMKDNESRTILHDACYYEDVSIIKHMITHAPDIIDAGDKNQMTPLCMSLFEEKPKALHYLLKYGANVSCGGGILGSPLHIATKKLNHRAVQKILECGADPNKCDGRGNSPLHYAIELMVDKNPVAKLIAQTLLEYKADPNSRNRENWTPLHSVARKRDGGVLEWILSYNFELEEIHGGDDLFKLNKGGGSFNWTPMHISAYVGAPELIYKLGEAGVDMFKKSVNGYTPKRVVNKLSLSLKLLEKYEKEWIKRNILQRIEAHPEDLAYTNLMRFNDQKEISVASKNKFDGVSPLLTSKIETSFLSFLQQKNRVRMLSPLLGTGPISKRQDIDDSFGLSSENSDIETREDIADVASEGGELIDFNSELNECVNIEVNNYSKEVPLAKNKKEITVRRSNSTHTSKYFDREKSKSNVSNMLELDNETYEMRLESISKFDLNFCRTELRFFKDNLTSNKLLFTEKLRVFLALRTLNKFIMDYIYRSFNLQVPLHLIQYFIMGKNDGKNRLNGGIELERSKLQVINTFYELVPQCLIGSFMAIGNHNYECSTLKINIIRTLTELKYYPAIDFLFNTSKNPLENNSVKFVAKACHHNLKVTLLQDAKSSQSR